ncbi:Der GTPase-activating protein YihI [Avibacterium sp. 20-129]|uniref:Der GTPase-activating protein YihI n=1 Tax=Avibacterium sp. 20-129 TaxID=2911525 RepID=UPI002247B932|nr:Der GTPase-activating protein YihI [Avibacterium sp. 20-129]MCW9699787.1 Der GTPase-activating protein YihI [Avibacterium sp. 20-129]
MSRQKKTRRITDIMPTRKADKPTQNVPTGRGRKLTRYELDAKAREEKRKKKHKGLAAGSRHSRQEENNALQQQVKLDPRVGSRKKIPLVVEFVNKPEKGMTIPPVAVEKQKALDPMVELEQLENNECLNDLLDELEAGKTLSRQDQAFVDECLNRIAQLMDQLGIRDDEENAENLYRTFETIDINQFK